MASIDDVAAFLVCDTIALLRDGLVEPWMGTVFQNNPFSSPILWMTKLQREIAIGHCTDAIVLCKLDPGTKWWAELVRPTARTTIERWEFHKRVQYDEHPDVIEARRITNIAKARIAGWPEARIAKITGKSQANFNSVIIHHRGVGMPALELEAVATRWVMVDTQQRRK